VRQPKRYESVDGVVSWKVRFRTAAGTNTSETFHADESEDGETKAKRFAQLLDLLGPTAALEQIYAGDQEQPAPLLNEVAADHFKYLTGIEEGTRLEYQRTWKRTWGPLLGALPVRSDVIDKDAVSAAVIELEKHYSPKSMKNHRGLLSGVVKRALDKQLLTVNPVKGVRLSDVTIDPDAADDEMTLLTMPQFDALSTKFSGVYLTLIRFLVGTGCRWGEATVVRKKDFDFTGPQPVVRIRRAVKHSGDGKVVIRGPKTKKSRRTIMVPRHLVPELESLMVGKKPDDLVFLGPRGGQIMHRNFWSGIWRPSIWRAQQCDEHYLAGCRCGGSRPKLCKLHPGEALPEPCGCPGTLPFWVRIHDLRHTHASWLLAAGIPIHVVSRRLGHESIQTTVDRYGHLLPDAQIAAAEAADIAFSHLSNEAAELEVEHAMLGLNHLLQFLAGNKELPPGIEAALVARGWTAPQVAIEA
jgi:integrase